MKKYNTQINKYLEKEICVLNELSKDDISTVMGVLEKARVRGSRVFVCGNGGSASTAAHMECDFNKGISYDKDVKYDFECLSDNVPMMMAIANDLGYDDVFVVPLRNKLKSGDIVLGISGSGNSENVIRALKYAKEKNAITISFTGYDGGELKKMTDYNIHVNVNNMQIVEDVHLILNHMMMSILSESEE